MKDEIKEILDKLLKYFKESNVNDFGYEQDKLISYEEAQIILDYITNLQESEAYYYGQYKDYKSRNEKVIEYLKYQISQLDFYEDTKAKMLGSMVLVLLQGEDKDEV